MFYLLIFFAKNDASQFHCVCIYICIQPKQIFHLIMQKTYWSCKNSNICLFPENRAIKKGEMLLKLSCDPPVRLSVGWLFGWSVHRVGLSCLSWFLEKGWWLHFNTLIGALICCTLAWHVFDKKDLGWKQFSFMN